MNSVQELQSICYFPEGIRATKLRLLHICFQLFEVELSCGKKKTESFKLRISPFIEAEMHPVAVVFFRELAAIFLRQLTFRHEKAFPVWASLLLHLTDSTT